MTKSAEKAARWCRESFLAHTSRDTMDDTDIWRQTADFAISDSACNLRLFREITPNTCFAGLS